jgi:hypothetical protein
VPRSSHHLTIKFLDPLPVRSRITWHLNSAMRRWRISADKVPEFFSHHLSFKSDVSTPVRAKERLASPDAQIKHCDQPEACHGCRWRKPSHHPTIRIRHCDIALTFDRPRQRFTRITRPLNQALRHRVPWAWICGSDLPSHPLTTESGIATSRSVGARITWPSNQAFRRNGDGW